MRIGLVSTLSARVSETSTGSVEQVVWLLAREFSALGHEVTIFACRGSEAHGEVVATLPGPYGEDGSPDDWQFCEWVNLCRAVEASHEFDVLHSHSYLWGLPLERLASAPMVHTLHVTAYPYEAQLLALAPDVCITAISRFQWSAISEFSPVAVVPHGVDPCRFTPRAEPDDYLCYLGRFTPGKRPTAAVELARTIGARLLLAGPADEYFDECVRPLVDGRHVEYVGVVRGEERDRLLGGAKALLYPIRDGEPFGLVLVEAMMCGTPVLATRIGATPEIVDEGVTGFLGDTIADLADRAPAVFSLDRMRVRERAATRFSVKETARRYLEVYEQQLARTRVARSMVST